jgi:NitT/TauT family transport system substrate-binding protein
MNKMKSILMRRLASARLFKWSLAPLVLSALAFSAASAQAVETISMAAVGKGSALEWPLYIGISKGFFAEKGIKLDMITAPSSASVQQWLTAGSVMIGTGGLADPIRAIDKGAKISLLRIEAQSAPYGLMAKPGIKSIAALRGKTISLGGPKDITRIYFERMAVTQGIKRGDYDQIYAGATASRFAALQSGVVDAAILTPPFNFRAEAANYTNLGYAADYVKDFPFTGYAVNTDWGRKNKPLLQNFLAAITRSVDWFSADANREEAIDIMTAASSTDRRDVALTYDLFRKIKIYDRKGAVDGSSIGKLVKALKDVGDVEGSTDVARFMDPELSTLASQSK